MTYMNDALSFYTELRLRFKMCIRDRYKYNMVKRKVAN